MSDDPRDPEPARNLRGGEPAPHDPAGETAAYRPVGRNEAHGPADETIAGGPEESSAPGDPGEDSDEERLDETVVKGAEPALAGRSTMFLIDPSGKLGASIKLRESSDEEMPSTSDSPETKYQILKLLGEGGMGSVFLAYDRDLKRRVALKMIREAKSGIRRRFLEEAQVSAQLEHPNIVAVHELGVTADQKPFYTMPVVRGSTLAEILQGLRYRDPAITRTYTLTRLMQIYLQVLQALSYAHEKGVVHRDLKPGNIMLGEHGEVQVVDWGLSKVFQESGVQIDLASAEAPEGTVLGTPLYMAPEQARGEPIDARADIYSLGILLYEMLCLAVPFRGEVRDVMSAHVHEEPAPPRSKARGRHVPAELEQICLQALRKLPEDRPQSAREIIEAVQSWIETESDRTARRDKAEERAQSGRDKLETYQRLKRQVERLEAEVEELERSYKGWQTVEEKKAKFEAEDRLSKLRLELTHAASETVTRLTEALGFEADHAGAREVLADYYWDRFVAAEKRQDEEGGQFFSGLVTAYHDGKYSRELKGDGSLTLESNPPGAEARLYRFVERNLCLVPDDERLLGTTPLGSIPLEMGSYLVVLGKNGYRQTRYPVHISRNRHWTGTVNLYTDGDIGDGFVYVPAGQFIQGGDEQTGGWSLPRSEPHVDDLFVAEWPVTMGEYFEFLDDLARKDPAEALARSVRRAPDGGSYMVQHADGTLLPPEVDSDGDVWNMAWPVAMISWLDAVEYCGWRSRRDGCEYRLPTETEWEKAARGVDGRWYPWGKRFDPSLCNMRDSRRERPTLVTKEECPADVSVYGVRGVGGNLRQWTATVITSGEGEAARPSRVLRGGAWDEYRMYGRCASRAWLDPWNVHHNVGFRLVKSGGRAGL